MTNRWRARPVIAGAIRVAAVGVPIALAILTGWLTSRLFGHADSVGAALLRIVTTAITSMVVLKAADRVGRRFVPLAALYKFSLVFPDHAPSRFGVALRSGNSKSLEKRIADATRGIAATGDGQDYFETLLELVAALNNHDRLTRGHCERTRAYTELVITELELPTPDADRLRWAALLHDIGKLGVDTEILNSTGRPTDAEWAQLRSHPEIGEKLAAPVADFLGPWMSAISQHHERYDGGGYPRGLAGHDIHLGGRIVCVTDAYDVMTSTRSYKKPMSATAAREELVRCAGTQFDPEIVRAFLAASLGRSRVSLAPLGALVHLREAFAILLHTPVAAAVTATRSAASVAGATGAAIVTAAALTGVSFEEPPPVPQTPIEVHEVVEFEQAGSTGSIDDPVVLPAPSRWESMAWAADAEVPRGHRFADEAFVEAAERRAEDADDEREKAAKAAEKAAKEDEKAREKAAKEDEKRAKDAAKDREKQQKEDEKAAEKAAKEREKQAEEDEKARGKAAEKAAKQD